MREKDINRGCVEDIGFDPILHSTHSSEMVENHEVQKEKAGVLKLTIQELV